MQPLMILRRSKMTAADAKTMVGDRGTDYGALMFEVPARFPAVDRILSASKFFMSGLTSGAVKIITSTSAFEITVSFTCSRIRLHSSKPQRSPLRLRFLNCTLESVSSVNNTVILRNDVLDIMY